MTYLVQPTGLLDLPIHELVKLDHYSLHYQLDLGEDHWAQFLSWAPDLSIEANREKWGHAEEIIKAHPVCGVSVIHRCKTETGFHSGAIHFRTPATALWAPAHAGHCWDVKSWMPLHVEPSLLSHCACNDHGFIRGGRWQRA